MPQDKRTGGHGGAVVNGAHGPARDAASPPDRIDYATLQRVVDDLPDAIIVIDDAERVILANRAAHLLFRYHDDALTALSLDALRVDRPSGPDPETAEARGWLGVASRMVRYRRRDGHQFEGQTMSRRLENALDGRTMIMYILRDADQSATAHRAMAELHEIGVRPGLSFAQRCESVLRLGCEYFGMAIGVISRIHADRYDMLHVVGPTDVARSGDSFPLSVAYCCHALNARGAFAIDDIPQAPEACNHPSYQRFRLESYIGDLLYIDHEVIGSINFTHPSPRGAFTAIDLDVIRMFAQWLSHEFTREHHFQALREAHAQLQDLATLDELTGIGNRRMLGQLLARELDTARQRGRALCVVLLDIDRFKAINDEHGHPGGDRILREFAELMRSSVRGRDVVGRWGGEEFMLLMPGLDAASAARIVTGLLAEIREQAIVLDACTVHITASAGLAQLTGSESADALIHRADRALYQAKDTGRDRLCIARQDAGAA